MNQLLVMEKKTLIILLFTMILAVIAGSLGIHWFLNHGKPIVGANEAVETNNSVVTTQEEPVKMESLKASPAIGDAKNEDTDSTISSADEQEDSDTLSAVETTEDSEASSTFAWSDWQDFGHVYNWYSFDGDYPAYSPISWQDNLPYTWSARDYLTLGKNKDQAAEDFTFGPFEQPEPSEPSEPSVTDSKAFLPNRREPLAPVVEEPWMPYDLLELSPVVPPYRMEPLGTEYGSLLASRH